MTTSTNRHVKILLIIVMIVVIIVALFYILQICRYLRLRSRNRLYELDKLYGKCPFKRHDHKYRVVISLSTIPERVKLLGPTLASLLDQSIHVDEIAINLPYVSRKGKAYTVPKWLKRLKHVKIYRVDVDEGPGTKLLPTLRRESPSTRIIVVDDDNIYHSGTIKLLLRVHHYHLHKADQDNPSSYYQGPNELVAVTNYGVCLDEDGDLPDVPERIMAAFYSERQVDLLQGFSGFLVTPGMFPFEALKIENCPKECISVDDIWFSGWLTINQVPIISSANMYGHLPLLTLGDIRKTPALAHGENKDFVTDKKVIQWFRHEYGIW